MRTRLFVGLTVVLLLASGAAFAQNQPSAKATAQAADLNVISSEDSNGYTRMQTILSQTIKTPNQKDLLIGVTMECGLLTKTAVKSKGGNRDVSVASAGVEVQVLVDGQVAVPGPVTFCRSGERARDRSGADGTDRSAPCKTGSSG